jgi:hypothetical protein
MDKSSKQDTDHNSEVNMKTTIWVGIAFAMLLFAIPTHAAIISGPSLNASLLYYQPVPATPGQLLDVYVQIANNGDTAHNMRVEFIDNYPFSLDNNGDRVKSVETIPGQQNFLLKYQVRVDQNAQPGTNYIKVTYGLSPSNTQTALLPIDVYGSALSLTIDSVKLSPKTFAPGSIGRMTITLRNNAGVKISSGIIKLDLAGLSIVPIGGTNQQRFTDIQANNERNFIFDLSPSPDLAAGVYQIPIILNFTDQNGGAYQQTEVVGIAVGSTPDISITIDDSNIVDDTGDVILRVTNKGLGEVKFVDVTLGNSDSYELISGSPEKYVGNIDSDDYKTARITVRTKEDILTIPVMVTYMDALNTPYNKSVTLSVPVQSTKTGSISITRIVLIILVIAIIGYVIYRRRSKKR